MKVTVSHNAEKLGAAIRRAPHEVLREADKELHRASIELTREARERAPKATSQLTQSIMPERVRFAEYLVAAHKDYASMQESGTGPGGLPNIDDLINWIKVRRIQPRSPGMTLKQLAFAIRGAIHSRGTPAQPFMRPAFAALEPALVLRVRGAIDRGIAGAMR